MRSLIYYVAATVDGFIADTNHGVGMFAHDGDHAAEYLAALRGYDTIVMGRKTWEFGQRLGVTDPYPWAETVVFGHFDESPDPRVRFTAEDPHEVVRELKRKPGSPIYLAGGGDLARSLFDGKAIDELVVKINPVLLGSGVGLAPRLSSAVRLQARACSLHASGVIVARYDVAYD
ncbi:MAG: dihydrofolate reductase [Proteobacteria bacterium]|nr:MAG: dihydrofolate reductase [Pseudomonadota bacterium]